MTLLLTVVDTLNQVSLEFLVHLVLVFRVVRYAYIRLLRLHEVFVQFLITLVLLVTVHYKISHFLLGGVAT